jgi:hypothetical protein
MVSMMPNNMAKLFIKKNDDNQPKMEQLRGMQSVDKITTSDNYLHQDIFRECKVHTFEPDIKDGDFLVSPLVISYVVKE